jgi:hypothetical protein
LLELPLPLPALLPFFAPELLPPLLAPASLVPVPASLVDMRVVSDESVVPFVVPLVPLGVPLGVAVESSVRPPPAALGMSVLLLPVPLGAVPAALGVPAVPGVVVESVALDGVVVDGVVVDGVVVDGVVVPAALGGMLDGSVDALPSIGRGFPAVPDCELRSLQPNAAADITSENRTVRWIDIAFS